MEYTEFPALQGSTFPVFELNFWYWHLRDYVKQNFVSNDEKVTLGRIILNNNNDDNNNNNINTKPYFSSHVMKLINLEMKEEPGSS